MDESTNEEITVETRKWMAIARGAEKEEGIGEHEYSKHYRTTTALAVLLAQLTSTSKDERAAAKQRVRELVQLGKEADRDQAPHT